MGRRRGVSDKCRIDVNLLGQHSDRDGHTPIDAKKSRGMALSARLLMILGRRVPARRPLPSLDVDDCRQRSKYEGVVSACFLDHSVCGRVSVRRDQILKEVSGERRFSRQIGFLIDRLSLLPNRGLGSASKSRNLFMAQSFKNEHTDVFLSLTHAPILKLRVHFMTKTAKMGLCLLAPSRPLGTCNLQISHQVQPFLMLGLRPVEQKSETNSRGCHQQQPKSICDNVDECNVIGLAQDLHRHQEGERNEANAGEHQPDLPLLEVLHHASAYPIHRTRCRSLRWLSRSTLIAKGLMVLRNHAAIAMLPKSRTKMFFRDVSIFHFIATPTSLLGVLLGTAGQFACSSPASAGKLEILAGGELKTGIAAAEDEQLSDGEGDRGYTVFTDSELYIEADLSPSDELDLGAEVVLKADADIGDVNADETFIFVSGRFGLIQLGRTEGAEEAMALCADTIAAGTGGIDGDTANLGEVGIVDSGDAAKISYFSPRLGLVQVGLSFTPDTGDNEGRSNDLDDDEELEDLQDHIGLGVNVAGELADDLEAGIALVGSYGKSEDSKRDDLDAFSIGGTIAIDDLVLGASYGNNDGADDVGFVTAGVTLEIGEANAGIGYHRLDERGDGITHIIALSGDVPLFPDIELQADVSYADPEDRRTSLASVLAIEVSF